MEFAIAPTPLGEPPVGLDAKVPDFVAHVKVRRVGGGIFIVENKRFIDFFFFFLNLGIECP